MVFCVLLSTLKKTKKISITNGLPCIIYASTRNFGVGKESAQQSTKVHFDDFFVSFFRNQIKCQIYQIWNIYKMNCFNNQSHPKCQLTILDNSYINLLSNLNSQTENQIFKRLYILYWIKQNATIGHWTRFPQKTPMCSNLKVL